MQPPSRPFLIWGTTFVSTRCFCGISTPVTVIFTRFVGYAFLWCLKNRGFFHSPVEETPVRRSGIDRVTLNSSLLENIALTHTFASNVPRVYHVAVVPFFRQPPMRTTGFTVGDVVAASRTATQLSPHHHPRTAAGDVTTAGDSPTAAPAAAYPLDIPIP